MFAETQGMISRATVVEYTLIMCLLIVAVFQVFITVQTSIIYFFLRLQGVI